jgi:hypothetical protein
MAGQSPLTRKLVADGCTPRPKLTEALALIERLEAAAAPGTSPSQRRKVCLEAAAHLRLQHGYPARERAA